jgi:hypothetical protein
LTDAYQTLISLLLPAGLLEYFDLVKVSQGSEGLQLYLEEKNIPPKEYEKQPLESKGFLPQVSIQDFPIRGQQVALQVKRRRWIVVSSGAIITRDWDVVQKGARMTTEFALFLKGIFG